MDTNAEHYQRYIDGDKDAFDAIVDDMFHKLVNYLNRYVQDYQAAEDIAVDTFVELFAYKYRYNFKVSLKTYVFMVGRSRALTYLRHHKRRNTHSFADVSELIDEAQEANPIEKSDQSLALAAAIEKLSSDMQSAVHLVYFEDLSYEDAGRVMKKSAKQIDNLLYRARKELKELLSREEVPF
ncbi:MAG: RNA polymerase sigma factor [Clostridia bacterium]|nr:RNA polymerase sigma factor [Clostridia bacterium]